MSMATFLSLLFTIALAVVAYLWWRGALYSDINSFLTILALSFCGALCGAIGLRHASGRIMAVVCAVVSGLIFIGMAFFLLRAAVGLSGIKG